MKTPKINSRVVKLEVLKGTATRASVNAVESRTTSLESDVATLTQEIVDARNAGHAALSNVLPSTASQNHLTDDELAFFGTLPSTISDLMSNVEEVDANFVSISYNPSGTADPDTPHWMSFANSGRVTWGNSSGFWSGSGAAFSIAAEVLAVEAPNSNWPTIARVGGLDGSGNAMILRIRRDYSPHRLEFYIAVEGTLYQFQSSASITFFDASWHKVVATSDGTPTGIKVYFDGTELSVSIANIEATTPGSPKLYVGGDSSGNAGWLGHIRQLCFSVGTAWSSADVIAWQGGSELPVAPTWVLDLTSGWAVDAVSGAAGAPTNFCSGFQIH